MDNAKNGRTAKAIREALCELMEPDAVVAWMDTPNGAFGGRTPADVIRTDPDLLWQVIYALRSGGLG